MTKVYKQQFDFAGKEVSFETGRLAKQAHGAVLMQMGGTVVLVTVAMSKVPREGVDFFPLTIDIDEKMYAAGKIPGGFIKREGRPSERAVLTARLTDRPLRPLFPKGFTNEVQVVATVLSVDQINPPDVLALNGASLALISSKIPFAGPVGAVRVGRVDGQLIINPTFEDIEVGDLDLVVAGTSEAITMVEAGANEVPEDEILVALQAAHTAIKSIIAQQQEFIGGLDLPEKVVFEPTPPDETLVSRVRETAGPLLSEVIVNVDKADRDDKVAAVNAQVVESLAKEFPERTGEIKGLLRALEKKMVRTLILDDGIRPDGRGTSEIRPITVEVGVLPRTHGTGLFTRGQTQALSVLALGTAREAQRIDGLGLEVSRRYMHHYNFPPFSVGEPGRMIGPKRREIGHGVLARRALEPVLPAEEDFPYTIRIVSEILESNGSTSQASICGSTLALMDAGVPISAPVAGIAMGLVKEDDKVAVLSDIQGVEDALGDMDFKVAGTAKGVTALQMDMKISGVSFEILGQALAQAKEGRLHILGKMTAVIDTPRTELSPYAPRIITIRIPTEKIREIIGPGGKVVQGIIAETGASIDIQDDGTIYVASVDGESGNLAKLMIESIVKDVEPGDVFMGTVTKIMPFGAFVMLKPGREGLVHISKLAKYRVEKVEDIVKEGERIAVRVVEIDRQNRVSLTAIDVEHPDAKKDTE